MSSEPGKGTAFRVQLPLVEVPVVQVTKPETDEWTGAGTVLVVDDDVTVRLVAQDTLEACGLEVLMAEDGVQALEIFRERADDISFVLLDLLMPRMDGGETCRALREIRPDVRVVLTSGYGEQEAFERFSIEGLAGFVKKPYFPDDLVRAIRHVLEGASLGQDAAS